MRSYFKRRTAKKVTPVQPVVAATITETEAHHDEN
jgi:hypothetical protein